MAEKSQKIIKCPVCNTKIWSHALKIHITNAGKAELYRAADSILSMSKNTFVFSKTATMLTCPHYKFRKEHITNKLTFEL